MWTSKIIVLCEKIRLNGKWLTQMTIITSALGQPKQTLSQCPSSPVSSLKGQLDTCPVPRHQSSKLSPLKTILSRLHFPLRRGGTLGLKGKESPYQVFGYFSLSHFNPNSGQGNREVHTPPISQARAEGTLVGDRWPAHGCPQPAQMTLYILCTTPGSIYS